MNGALRAQLTESLRRIDRDDSVGAIVLTGAGDRAFCAGQDLEEAAALEIGQIEPWLTAQHAMYQAVRDLDKPCVAAINGVAAGAGFQIALCADWRVIAPDTRIGQPEIRTLDMCPTVMALFTRTKPKFATSGVIQDAFA